MMAVPQLARLNMATHVMDNPVYVRRHVAMEQSQEMKDVMTITLLTVELTLIILIL